jgi:hypothetical protein
VFAVQLHEKKLFKHGGHGDTEITETNKDLLRALCVSVVSVLRAVSINVSSAWRGRTAPAGW